MKCILQSTAVIALTLGAVYQPAGATIITSGCSLDGGQSCTLSELVNDHKYIEIDGARFQNFDQLFFSDADLSKIKVSAIDSVGDGYQIGNTVGLKFTTFDGLDSLLEAFSSSSYSVDRFLYYDIVVINGLPIAASDMSVHFGDYSFTGGLALDGGVLKTIDRSGLSSVAMSALCSQYSNDPAYSYSCGGMTAFDNEAFGSVYNLSVTDNLFISHVEFTSGDDGMQLQSMQQTYYRVPEPGTLSLVGLSLLGFAAKRRKLVSMS